MRWVIHRIMQMSSYSVSCRWSGNREGFPMTIRTQLVAQYYQLMTCMTETLCAARCYSS